MSHDGIDLGLLRHNFSLKLSEKLCLKLLDKPILGSRAITNQACLNPDANNNKVEKTQSKMNGPSKDPDNDVWNIQPETRNQAHRHGESNNPGLQMHVM